MAIYTTLKTRHFLDYAVSTICEEPKTLNGKDVYHEKLERIVKVAGRFRRRRSVHAYRRGDEHYRTGEVEP
jgi:hypothetical protein